MHQPKVNILLSTYNGERFLSQQLDSLLSQTYSNITILIRDDGSSDHSLDIILHYIEENNNIVLINDQDFSNTGYKKSFWTLLNYDSSAEYYCFCDQDDVWLPNKVELGVQQLELLSSQNIPLLYSSSFQYCDANLIPTGTPPILPDRIPLKDVLFYTPAFGFTIMINKTLRNAALSSDCCIQFPHDSWCQKLAASLGIFYYDNTVTALYRRHTSTVTYADSSKWHLLTKWIQNDIFGNTLHENHRIIYEFLLTYKRQLPEESIQLLSLFAEQPLRLSNYFKRLFYPRRLRPSLGGEFALRLCFLLNK